MYPPSLRLISCAVCPKMFGNCLTNRRNGWNAAERDQKSTKFGEHHDECIHQVWDQSPGLFVRKCMETTKVWQMDRQIYHEPASEWMYGQAHFYNPPSLLLPTTLSRSKQLTARSIYITVTMTYMTSSIFVITSSDYGSLPNHHQIIAG